MGKKIYGENEFVVGTKIDRILITGKAFYMVKRKRIPKGCKELHIEYLCDCGRKGKATDYHLRRKVKTKQCYFCDRKSVGDRARTHGKCKLPIHSNWGSMRNRCTERFQKETGRYVGVKCDPRWSTFQGFLDNQPEGRKYEKGLALSRKGDKGNYAPENCRWITRSENSKEARDNVRLLLPDGRPAILEALKNGIKRQTFCYRIHHGWDPFLAISTPVKIKG